MPPVKNHDWNSYSNHISLIERHLERFGAFFDEDAGPQTLHYYSFEGLVEPNRLYFFDGEASSESRIIAGVYVLAVLGKRAKISIFKELEIERSGNQALSKTKLYSYHVTFTESESQQIYRILRFDNQHETRNHQTPHHFHCEITNRNKKSNPKSVPLHIGEHYPYLSDIFEITQEILTSTNPNKVHSAILDKITKLSASERSNAKCWSKKLAKELPQLAYLSLDD